MLFVHITYVKRKENEMRIRIHWPVAICDLQMSRGIKVWNQSICTLAFCSRSVLCVILSINDHLGPVCVVSIAGPYRKGKSYLLSEAFCQPQVFPLGHHMEPETMGIWLWIVPEKFRVCMIIILIFYINFFFVIDLIILARYEDLIDIFLIRMLKARNSQ